MANLYYGSSGDDVKKLQQQLIDAGYDLGSGGADGIFGDATLAAVKQYQTDNGLSVDGIVGSQTMTALANTASSQQNTTPTVIPKGGSSFTKTVVPEQDTEVTVIPKGGSSLTKTTTPVQTAVDVQDTTTPTVLPSGGSSLTKVTTPTETATKEKVLPEYENTTITPKDPGGNTTQVKPITPTGSSTVTTESGATSTYVDPSDSTPIDTTDKSNNETETGNTGTGGKRLPIYYDDEEENGTGNGAGTGTDTGTGSGNTPTGNGNTTPDNTTPSGNGDTPTGNGDTGNGDIYDPYSDAAYTEAMRALAAASDAPTYANSYEGQLADLYNQIVNRDKFQYDINSDMLYQQYAQQYADKGQLAMMDTMGQAAALTGGYGSSYAQSVGQQQYDAYLQQLNDVIPELYQQAYNQYQDEGDALTQQYSLLRDLADDEYSKYTDAYNRYLTERDYQTERADTEYNRSYNEWLAALDQQNADRDYALDMAQFEYGKEQDAIANALNQQTADRDYELALINAYNSGNSGSGNSGSGSTGDSGTADIPASQLSADYTSVWKKARDMFDTGSTQAEPGTYLQEMWESGKITENELNLILDKLGY